MEHTPPPFFNTGPSPLTRLLIFSVLSLALLIGTPVISWLLTRDAGVALYAAGLGAMAIERMQSEGRSPL